MPTPSIDQIVRKGADTISRLVEIGADPLGLSGSTGKGEPLIAIRPPGQSLCESLRGQRMWKVELEGQLLEEGFVAYWEGCFIFWTVFQPVLPQTLH